MDARTDLDLAGPLRTRHLEAHHRFAVEHCRRTLLGDGVDDGSDLVRRTRRPSLRGDFIRSQFLCRRTVASRRTDCSAPPRSVRPPAASTCTCFNCRDTSAALTPECLHAHWVELHLHLPVNAADAGHRADAAHGQQLAGERVVHEPRQCPRRPSRFDAMVKASTGLPARSDLVDHRIAQVTGSSARTRETAERTSSTASPAPVFPAGTRW